MHDTLFSPEEINLLKESLARNNITLESFPAQINPSDAPFTGEYAWIGLRYGMARENEKALLVMASNKPNAAGDPWGTSVLDLFFNQQEISKKIAPQIPENLKVNFVPTLDVFEVSESIIALTMPWHEKNIFLGNQVKGEISVELPDYFEPHAKFLHFLESLPHQDLKRNISNTPEGLLKAKAGNEKKTEEKIQKLAGSAYQNESELLKSLENIIKEYSIDLGFSTFDRVPWWTVMKPDGSLGILNYFWGGFRDRYYDALYFFIKLWVFTLKSNIAKQWLKVYVGSFEIAEERKRFEKQMWGVLAERILGDLEESASQPKRRAAAVELAKLIAVKDLKKLLG